MNTCGNCDHWRLEGQFAKHGLGHCAVRPDPVYRAGIFTPATATCRIGRFEAKKQGDATVPSNFAQRVPQAPSAAPEGPF